MNAHALYGDDLDKAVAYALGWHIHETNNSNDSFYMTEGKPVLVSFFKPTQSARQAMRLLLDHGISTIYDKKTGVWTAYIMNEKEQKIEAKAKRLHEAACRCFVLFKNSTQ